MLVSKDSKQAQSNHQSTSKIALFLLVFDITNSSENKDSHTNDDKKTAPEARTIFMNTGKGLEETNHRGKDNPAVPQRERSMDEKSVPPRVGRIVLLQVICMHDISTCSLVLHHDIVLTEDIGYRRSSKQQEDEANNVVGVLLQMSHAKMR